MTQIMKTTIDQSKNTFLNYVKKTSQKIHAIERISSYRKNRLITNEFISSEFGYCPLFWMFHNRRYNNNNNKINCLH